MAQQQSFPPFAAALKRLHDPADPIDVSPEGAAWRRLAYDEFLAGQVSLALMRANVRRLSGRPLTGDGRIEDAIRKALPYSLTGSQEFALAEIDADLAEPERMLRLLQGDVGSGKTVVALLAMARAVEAGGQAALMAPTEILARQHLATIAPLAERAGLRIADPDRPRKGPRARRDAGRAGRRRRSTSWSARMRCSRNTVTFRDLVLAVVDEQHRFGVHQRLAINAKGDAPDMLVMTATPIPRTLVLTAFGDMDVSRLTEKPAGRQPIRTVTLPLDRLDELIGRICDAVADGQKVYWICPLVEESEEIKLTSAEDRFAILQQEFGDIVGLVHGRMKGAEKDEAMRAFKEGETKHPGRDDRDRGRRRRARRDDHGDRACRAVRPGAAAPAARPRRARRQSRRPACCSTRSRSARRRSGGCR